jgi:hypothetical protein|tara:strand:- start:293 stop:511 length:219 start_codon:yes stop_codon:yes gene_type:complete
MINNKEMFCTLFGALTMIDTISAKNKSKLIRKAGESFGLSEDQIENIIADLDKTIAFILSNMLQDKEDIDYK